MWKTFSLGIALAFGIGGIAAAQTLRPPTLPQTGSVLLVKHDKDGEGHGRKLGHFKHRGGGEGDDEDEGGRAARRFGGFGAPAWRSPAPYYGAPGYGGSYGPPPYSYYPPPYYGGY